MEKKSRNFVAILASLPAPWLLTAWETLPKPKQTLLLLVHSVETVNSPEIEESHPSFLLVSISLKPPTCSHSSELFQRVISMLL